MREIKVSAYPTAVENRAERRRSHRVYITMPIIIGGKNNLSFNEETHTASVNAHSCIVQLAEKVVRGQEVAILNPETVEELPCTVIFVGQKESGKAEVGLEFTEPSPLFWRMTFPSEDWDPSERKGPTSPSARAFPGATGPEAFAGARKSGFWQHTLPKKGS
jgi:hypothetical protein